MNKIISLFRRDKPADRQRSMSEIVAFSAILFAIIFTAGVISFRVSMRYVISLSKKGELTQMLEIERIKRDVFINEMTPIIEEMSVALRFSQGFGTSFTKTQMSEVADLHSNSFKLISWINHSDRILHIYDPHFFDPNHFTDGEFTVGDEALDTSLPENSWYYTALSRTYAFYFHIKDEMLWLNAPVFDNDGRPVGVVGIGIYQSEFVQEFYRGHDEKTQIYLYNPAGEITVSRGAGLKIDIERVLSVAKRLDSGQTTTTFSTNIGEVAVGVIPSMGWYSVAVSPNSLDDFINPVAVVFMVLLLVIALIFVVFNIFIGDVIKSLRAALTSLETTSQYKDKFFATVSHEMRTPMNAIIGIAQIELQKDDITEEHAGALEKIYASGNGLLGIVNDLLDMSKMASGKLDLAPTAYDMPSLINDAVQVNVVRIGSKPIEFMLDVDENLPSSLFGDELRLKQILNNLLSNAIKYTDEGHVKLSVNHTICGEEAILRFVVEDTGQGMKEEDCKRLFSEYARFNTEANRSTEGAGLGLNITKRLVEMMRGTITAESEYGKGTTFTVELKQGIVKCRPIGEELAVKLNNFTFSGEKQVSKLRLNREYMPYGKVLVVDDVDTNLFVAKGLLMPYGINVETVNSGFAALDKIKEGN
ncbi:MAG: ATP-binding protein, partial [Chitinivibrionia bacterium]|nr:ATP-binding protein [Chitinivibrionia bacterium]